MMTDYKDVDIALEANTYESVCLWQEINNRGIVWIDGSVGHSHKIGRLCDMPVVISVIVNKVADMKVAFIDPTSQVVDWRMIDEWIKENMPRAERADGINFTSKVINRISDASQYQ